MTSATSAPSGTGALATYAPSLDGLRGICIAGVVVYHACAANGFPGWVRGGFIGVSVFFTLSGFLITSLLLRERTRTGAVDLRNFWSRRIRRLWPASLVVTLAVLLLSAWGPLTAQTSDVIAATWNVTNWHVIAGGDESLLRTIVGPLGPTWSLAVEEQFYIGLALLAAVVAGRRHALQVLTAVSVLGIAVPIVLINTATYWQPSLEFNTFLRLPELCVGVVLALWYSRDSSWHLAAATADVMAAFGVTAILGLFLLADYSPPWLLRGGYTLVAMVTAATIVGLLHGVRIPQVLAKGPLRQLGVISYSLYLLHWPIITLLSLTQSELPRQLRLGFSVVLAVAAAAVLHVAVERPIRRLQTPPLPTIVTGLLAAAAVSVIALVAL